MPPVVRMDIDQTNFAAIGEVMGVGIGTVARDGRRNQGSIGGFDDKKATWHGANHHIVQRVFTATPTGIFPAIQVNQGAISFGIRRDKVAQVIARSQCHCWRYLLRGPKHIEKIIGAAEKPDTRHHISSRLGGCVCNSSCTAAKVGAPSAPWADATTNAATPLAKRVAASTGCPCTVA